jgi:Baseplate J-like protein
MTAAASSTPISVDYTGRDYYAIRTELIKRVQERVPDWQGTDPNDFGLALIEAFAYMGDLVNYYIDRVANETYLLTATQRESLLNLAATYGYRPANYVSATTDLTITSSYGYRGDIGGAIIETGTFTATAATGNGSVVTYTCANTFVTGEVVTITGFSSSSFNLSSATITAATATTFQVAAAVSGTASGTGTVSLGNYAKVIVPNNNTFTTSATPPTGYYNKVVVNSMPDEADGFVGSRAVKYKSSAFNGTFPVSYVGYDNFGKNVVWYRPMAQVSNVAATTTTSTATVTAASADGTTVTYTAVNSFLSGESVTITGLSTTAFNLTSVIIDTATSTQFTVKNAATGTAVTGASGVATATDLGFTVSLSDTNRTLAPQVGQRVHLRNVSVISGANYNGIWVVNSVIDETPTTPLQVTFRTAHVDSITSFSTAASISKAVVTTDGNYIMYSAWNGFVTGETVSITGSATAAFNLSNKVITSRKNVEAIVSRTSLSSSVPTYFVSVPFAAGDFVTIRGISSVGNETAQSDLGYNLTDQVISSVASVTSTINSVVGASPTSERITYQTASAHSFSVGDYVTMTGIANTADSTTSRTDVYNLSAAKILSVPNTTSFVVQGYWTQSFNSAGSSSPTATLYSFTLSSATVSGTYLTTGSAVSEYFQIAKPSGFSGTWTTSTNALATPVVGGTYSSGGELVYAQIPTLVTSGPYVTAIGSTTVPKGTQVSTNVTVEGVTKQVIFSTLSDVAVPYQSTATVSSRHGEDITLRTENAAVTASKPYDIAGELLGYSDGSADQSFALKEVEVSTRDVRVFVDNGVAWEEWAQVEHVNDYPASSQVFQVDVLASEEVRVVFGDGISGQIPPKESGIKAAYFAGGGVVGNVASYSLTTWESVLGNDASIIKNDMTVTNYTAAVGGANPESNDSIRYNAPKALRALNRAVTLEDFANIALAVDGVVKANAVANSRSSVTVYIAPSSVDETTPGVDLNGYPTTSMSQYISYVSSYLASKKQIGTTVTVLEPVYTPVHVELQYSLLPQYNSGLVETAIKNAILADFSYDNLDFGDVITPEEVEFKIRQVDGVSNAKITGLYRDGGSGRNSLIGDPYEIFVFSGDDIGISANKTAAILNTPVVVTAYNSSGTSLGNGTISPTVNGGVFSYTLSLPFTTSTLTVSAATTDSTASVSVNDNVASYNSGTGAYTVTGLPVPSSAMIISVTAQDGVTVNSYKFKVSVATS